MDIGHTNIAAEEAKVVIPILAHLLCMTPKARGHKLEAPALTADCQISRVRTRMDYIFFYVLFSRQGAETPAALVMD